MIKSNIIKSIIYKLLDFSPFSRPDLIKFLASICQFKDEPIYVNQTIIFRTLIENKTISKYALMTLTYHDDNELFL